MNCSHTEKEWKKHPVYKDKETRKKVVIVRGTLILDFMIKIFFSQILVYIILLYTNHGHLQKNFIKIFGKKTMKNRLIIAIIYTTLQHFSFQI